ncbi:hypothetical protein ACFVWY_27045 [Streptomyces sp. NPDC058195]|uniref:hypothetical protein n=1 Tax=Streptomyces sp. NPDC058195 TaxID=3346375 RepID=UPI0036E5A1F7
MTGRTTGEGSLMRTLARTRGQSGVFGARTGAALVLTALVLLGGTGAGVADGPSPAPGTAAPGTAAAGTTAAGDATQPERLAGKLRGNPVYVSAARPRDLPRSLAPDIAALAGRTGVPTYVLALPAGDATLLALVHDRLGEDGLYVLISGHNTLYASAFGVDVPADEALRVALYGTPYRAGPLAAFESFADAIASGRDRAASRADALYARYRTDGRPGQYISATDRQNQNLLLGLAVVVVPGLVLALGVRLSLRRPRTAGGASPDRRRVRLDKNPDKNPGRGRGEGGGKGRDPGMSAVRQRAGARAWFSARRRGVLPVSVVAVVAAVIAVVQLAPAVFPQTVDGPYLRVTEDDLGARVEEAAAGLAAGPVYQDPSTADVLSGPDLSALRRRIAALVPRGPVRVLVTASSSDDESGGDRRLLLARVHQRTGQDGVYVLVDPVSGVIDLDTFGTGRDAADRFRSLSSSVSYPEYRGDGGLRVMPRLDKVLDAVAEAGPDEGGDAWARDTALPPLHDNRLPGLFSSDFGPGVMLGALLLCVLLPVLWLLRALVRVLLRRSRRTAPAEPAPSRRTGPRRVTALPSVRQLRAWAGSDARELAAQLAAAARDAPGRARAWDCLDAAGLLAGTGDGPRPDRAGEAGTLVAVVVLARAGLASLGDRPPSAVCRLNPLHGEATGGRVPAWLAEHGTGPRSARLCLGCRGAFRVGASGADCERAAAGRLLSLPATSGGARVSWDKAGPVLPAALEGIDALILRARESASVQ